MGWRCLACTVLPKEEVYFAFPLRLGEESQRLLNELTRQTWQCNRELRLRATAVYIYETRDLYIIEAAFPELETENVRISVEGADIVVSRELAQSQRGESRGHSGNEIRRIPLPPSADETTMVVQFDHGVLRAALKIRNPTGSL